MSATPVVNLQNFEKFLTEYKKFHTDWCGRRMAEFENRFVGMRAGLRALRELSAKRDRFEAPDFNLFQVLGIHTREVKTHSALLADLFSPNGRHGQGDLFLRAFLSHLSAREKVPPKLKTMRSTGWETDVEYAFDDGRIDIVLRHPREGALIVIENKIYAGDQEEQLDRYWRWMEKQKYAWPNQLLIYLTLDGHSPATQLGKEEYLSLTYKTDITQILEKTLPQIPSPVVSAVIHQYHNLLPTL